MSHNPTLEERVALLESIILPIHEDAECPVPDCCHYCDCEDAPEAVGDQGTIGGALDTEIDETLSAALDALRAVLEEGSDEDRLAAAGTALAFLLDTGE